jgi:hypothetical protein
MSRLRAAAGSVDLRPVVGARLTGFAARLEPSTGIHDPVLARLLLLDDESSRLLWTSCDLVGFDPEDDAELRRRLSAALSIAPNNVLVSCTHTHSGPCSMPFRGALAAADREWLAHAFDAITEIAASLVASLRPARLTHATETVTGIGYNRQDRAGPIDERLLVAQISADDGDVIATILNYATHPVVLGPTNLLFSGDYAGYASRLVEQCVGGVALFVQGSAGDVNPLIFRDNERDAGTFKVAEQMGRALASAAERAIKRATVRADARIASSQQIVELPLARPPSPEELSAMRSEWEMRRAMDDEGADGRYATFQLEWAGELACAMTRGEVPRTLRVQLFAVRVGELHVVTFPLEIYSRIGLDVRASTAPHPVIIAGYTNGLLGYAPTDEAIEQGGYGPAISYRFFPRLLTPLARGSADRVVMAALGMLERLG